MSAGRSLWDRALSSYDATRAAFDGFDWNEWEVVQNGHDGRYSGEAETLFAVSNGFLGLRGAVDEDGPVHERATLVNGFHETWPIVYGETAYGFAKTGQTIVPVPDATLVKLYVDDEPFRMDRVIVRSARRTLDMRAGILRREVEWEAPDGRLLAVRTRRFASLEHRHVAVLQYEVELLDSPGTLTISSELAVPPPRSGLADHDPRRAQPTEGVLLPVAHQHDDDRAVMVHRTARSAMSVACGMHHVIDYSPGAEARTECGDGLARTVVIVDGEPGHPVRLCKFVAYHTSASAGAEELLFRVGQTLNRALHVGFEGLEQSQVERTGRFWRVADVRIDGAPDAQAMVRFNLFQLQQATERADGMGLPAKGLTGTGYEGQYFWDADIYVLPFLAYTFHQRARNFVNFRAGMLDRARERAAEVGHRGALYPWRTINGEEASAYYAAGTAQYHINADVVWAMRKYVRTTGDLDAIADPGLEILAETARLWVDLGFFSERLGGEFVINGVTGPDEYTTVVDNNLYTNLMARENLLSAAEAAEWIRGRRPDRWQEVTRRTGLKDEEVDLWRRAAEKMHVPFDAKERLYLQDDGFLSREMWDFAGTPPEKYPLLLNFHPLEIYRHQVIKQADVVLATFLLGHWFSEADKRRIFEYYDPLTTGDSSLSASVQSVMATELGLMENAVEYFVHGALVDLLDLAGNVRDGVHLAACGGTWIALVHGFGGLRDNDGELHFRPAIPSGWTQLTFRLQHLGNLLEVSAGHDHVVYTLLEGEREVVHHWDEEIHLGPGEAATRRNPRREELPRLANLKERPLEDRPVESHDAIDFDSIGPALPYN